MNTQIKSFLVSIAIVAAATCARSGTFSDDFSTGLDASCWSVIQQTTNFFLVDASQGNVQLAKTTAHNPGGIQGIYVRLNFALFGGRITNDFSTQVYFTNAVVPGPGLDQVELHTYYQDGSIYYAVYDNSSGYNAHVWDGGGVQGAISAPQNYGTFRLSRTNGIVTAYFNGTPLYSETRNSPLTGIDFCLQNNNSSDDATAVAFDNFSLTAASVSQPQTRSGDFHFVSLTNVANFTWASPDIVHGEAVGTRLPGAPVGRVTLGGVPFDITSNTNGKQAWHADIAAGGGAGQVSITLPVNVLGATEVYSLINTWCGQPGPTAYAWLVFTGSGGATYTKNLVGGLDICDYNLGPWENDITSINTINVFACASDNWGNPGRLDMQQIALPPAFATQTLVSIQLVDNGGPNFQRVVLDGLTVQANRVPAPNLPVAHWINDAGQDAATVLNTNGVFVTDFKTHNDLTVTRLTADAVSLYTDAFGGATPGNNPAYLTNFVGVTNNGTGDGIAGDIEDLVLSDDSTATFQFDFLHPLTPQDRILLVDVDGAEQYLLQAYVINGSATNQVSFVGWPVNDYSGMTGTTPNASWPVWNPAAGTLTSGSSVNLNEELFVLTPAQNINRLVVSKQSGANWGTAITFVSLQTLLTIRQSGTNVVLTWTNSAFGLQAAPAVSGTYTNLPNATSPYTNTIAGQQQFFRVIAN